MKFGLVYSSPVIYNLLIKFLYGRNWQERYKIIANHIPDNSQVTDLCAGTDIMYQLLKLKNCNYTAFDINPTLVKALNKAGANARVCNVKEDSLPESDYFIINASLYHFLPDAKFIIQRAFDNAKKGIIILEPVQNYGDSGILVFKKIIRWLCKVDNVTPEYYFNETTFSDLLKQFPGLVKLEKVGLKERDMLGIIKK